MAPRSRRLAAALAVAVAAVAGAAGEAAGPASSPARVVPGYTFEFPRDHFAHPGFESEWWYYTGNLFTASGRHFGFELTFFRRARSVDVQPSSAWDLDQVYLAHFTVTDTDGGRFVVDERLNRAGPGIGGADAEERRVWNGNWSVEWRPGDEDRPVQVLTAMNRDAALRLVLEPRKPVVVHGREGVSRKVAGDRGPSRTTSPSPAWTPPGPSPSGTRSSRSRAWPGWTTSSSRTTSPRARSAGTG